MQRTFKGGKNMALDRILIGTRIRRIREEVFEETREKFAKRCDLTERHVGQLERGDILLSLETLDKISISTGIDTDYILYGKCENSKLQIKQNLLDIIDKSDKDELNTYYKCICLMRSYANRKAATKTSR